VSLLSASIQIFSEAYGDYCCDEYPDYVFNPHLAVLIDGDRDLAPVQERAHPDEVEACGQREHQEDREHLDSGARHRQSPADLSCRCLHGGACVGCRVPLVRAGILYADAECWQAAGILRTDRSNRRCNYLLTRENCTFYRQGGVPLVAEICSISAATFSYQG